MKHQALAIVAATALAGCSAPPMDELQANLKELAFSVFASKGQATLSAALKRYEDGDYAAAETGLQTALEQGLPRMEQVMAHKHLAFIHCAADRQQPCREEFRKALAIDPALELAPAEAGHPAWGPVFRAAKAGR
jgi:Tfp pilus assembly protein PilF